LRAYTATEFYLHPWDERFHALVAKNLIKHPLTPTLYDNPILAFDYKSWYGNHIWLHKQPFPLWGMAASMFLFGINEIALRLPSILLTTIGIWITYSIGNHLYNSKVGFIAAFLYSIHGLIIESSAGRVATDHIDIFFLFFIQLAVLMAIKHAERKKIVFNVLCGICIGAAILSKWLPALIVLPIWFLLVSGSGNFTKKETYTGFALLCCVTIIVFLPWQIYTHIYFPLEAQWEGRLNISHLNDVVEGHRGPFYYHFDNMRIQFGELIYIPLVWILWKTIKKWKNYSRLALVIWFIVPYLFFSLAKTKMQGYTLFTAPAIFIITAVFWQYLYHYRKKMRFKWLTYILLFLLLALPVRYSIERIKPFDFRERRSEWVQEIRKLDTKGSGIVLFNYEHPIEAMFYSDCVAYTHIPDVETIEKITASGYEVFINDNGLLPEDFTTSDKVRVIKLKVPPN